MFPRSFANSFRLTRTPVTHVAYLERSLPLSGQREADSRDRVSVCQPRVGTRSQHRDRYPYFRVGVVAFSEIRLLLGTGHNLPPAISIPAFPPCRLPHNLLCRSELPSSIFKDPTAFGTRHNGLPRDRIPSSFRELRIRSSQGRATDRSC